MRVVAGGVYALLVTSSNGLWRYEIGDRVEFTSTDPYRIRFAGRTRQYINVFGEEVIVNNTDAALARACARTGAAVSEYTVAPLYMSLDRRGAHECGSWSSTGVPPTRRASLRSSMPRFAPRIRTTTPNARPRSTPCV